jgi:putative transposase
MLLRTLIQDCKGDFAMSDLIWLSKQQVSRIKPYFPLSHGVPRVDDRRVLSGIIFVIRNGLRWRDAPKEYGPHKTLYNRFIRWSRLGVFDRIFASLAAQIGVPETLMIDATHLKAHVRLVILHNRSAANADDFVGVLENSLMA